MSNEKKHFVVPVYVYFNYNVADLTPSKLDYGILYSNSGINHKLPIKVNTENKHRVRLGFPYVQKHSYFEYDFTELVESQGMVVRENNFLVGTVTLKTQGLKEGDYEGYLLFCKDKVWSHNQGKTRLFYSFSIHNDPLNAKSKMHSFEITSNNLKNKKKSFQIQLLWLKNTFHYPIKIDDMTCEDKEMSLTYMVTKKFEDISEDQQCCLSSLTANDNSCKGCSKSFIDDVNAEQHKLTLKPEDENEDVKIRYEYQLNRSKTIEVKFIIVWTNGTYIPIPVFIYDKSLACAFDYYNDLETEKNPFMLGASQCNNLPDFRQFDFGPILEGYTHNRTLTIANLNPMAIFIDKIRIENPIWDGSDSGIKIRLIPETVIDLISNKPKRHFEKEDKIFDKPYDPDESDNINNNGVSIIDMSDFMMTPNSLVTFTVQIITPKIRSTECQIFESMIYFSSYHAPDFEIPVAFQLIKGDIKFLSDTLEFESSIPGVQQKEVLKAIFTVENFDAKNQPTWDNNPSCANKMSSSSKVVFVKSIRSSNPNVIKVENLTETLEEGEKTRVAELTTVPFNHFSAYVTAAENAMYYSKMIGNNTSRLIKPDITYFDVLAWQVESKEWDRREQNSLTESEVLITLDTNVAQNITIPVRTKIERPKLLNMDVLDFGKVEVDTEKRVAFTIFNPSSNPIEVSFAIAPTNFLDLVLNELLSDDKLIKWKHVCDKSTFFNPYGRQMWEGLIELQSSSEEKKDQVIDYFLKNFFHFIMNSEITDNLLKDFVFGQMNLLEKSIKNITDSTKAVKPDVKKRFFKQDSMFDEYYSMFSKVNLEC